MSKAHTLPTLHRVPGPMFPTRSDRQSYAKDLTKITKPELLEILEREEKLLKNKAKLDKLPDKGEKIRVYYEKVQAEVLRRNDVEFAAEQFSRLNIAQVGKKALDNLEWTGSTKDIEREEVVDSDDDVDVDPLKIIANSNEANKIVKLQKEETLITEEDLKEIESFKTADSHIIEVSIKNKSRMNKLVSKMDVKTVEDENKLNEVAVKLEPHALRLVEVEKISGQASPKPKFLPCRTTVSDVHDPEKEIKRRNKLNWEATAATPPLLKHKGVQALNLQESIQVQKEKIENFKRLQEQQAKNRLAQAEIRMRDRSLIDNLYDDLSHFSDYRDPAKENSSEEEGDDDEEGGERGACINYVIEEE